MTCKTQAWIEVLRLVICLRGIQLYLSKGRFEYLDQPPLSGQRWAISYLRGLGHRLWRAWKTRLTKADFGVDWTCVHRMLNVIEPACEVAIPLHLCRWQGSLHTFQSSTLAQRACPKKLKVSCWHYSILTALCKWRFSKWETLSCLRSIPIQYFWAIIPLINQISRLYKYMG